MMFGHTFRLGILISVLVAGGYSITLAKQIPSVVVLTNPSQTNDSDLILNWLSLTTDVYGNVLSVSNYNIYCSSDPAFAPDLTTHTNRLGSTDATSFIHAGALTTSSNLFYYISAVGTNGSESLVFSNLVGKLTQNVVCPPGSNVFTWLALPTNFAWTNAEALATQLGVTGMLYRLNDTNQSYEVWDTGAGTGVDFTVIAGESYGVELSTSAVLNVYGAYGTLPSFTWEHYTNQFNHHWLSVPPHSIYGNAAALAGDIPGCTKVAVYDPVSSQFTSWFNLNDTWYGSNFGLNPAQSVIVSVASNVTWQPKSAYPQAAVTLQANAGFVDLTTAITATGTNFAGASGIVEFAWDYTGDGIIDQSNSTPISVISLPVTNVATYFPTYRTKDVRGFYAIGYARYDALSMSLSFSNQAFRAGLDETGTVCYASSTNGYFSVSIYDASNNLVRVLESNVWHQTGNACLDWDGRDDSGNLVSNGAYYAVVGQQTLGGAVAQYDPKPLLLGSNITSQITGISIPGQFDPYSGGLFPIQYTLPNAARVTVLIQDAALNTIAVVCSNALRLVGPQTEYWDGRLLDGTLLGPGQTFRVAIEAVAIGNNALLVQRPIPSLTSLQCSATKFTPSINPYGLNTNGTVTLTYTLDKPADVRITVRNSQGQVVQDALEPGKPAGADSSIWAGTDSLGRLVAAGVYSISVSPEIAGQSGIPSIVWVETYY